MKPKPICLQCTQFYDCPHTSVNEACPIPKPAEQPFDKEMPDKPRSWRDHHWQEDEGRIL